MQLLFIFTAYKVTKYFELTLESSLKIIGLPLHNEANTGRRHNMQWKRIGVISSQTNPACIKHVTVINTKGVAKVPPIDHAVRVDIINAKTD